MYVVIEYDMEEADQTQAAMGVYGPFDTETLAEQFATKKWEEWDEEMQEFRGIEVHTVDPITKWDENHKVENEPW